MRLDRGTLDTALDTDSLRLFDIVTKSFYGRVATSAMTRRDPLEDTRILFPVARAYRVSQFRGFFAPASLKLDQNADGFAKLPKNSGASSPRLH